MEINELFNLKESNSPLRKSADDQNVFKHLKRRLGVFFAILGLLFIAALLIDDDYVTIGAVLIGAGLFLILLLFLLIESFILFSNKKKILARTNLFVVSVSILIVGIVFLSNM